MSCRPRRARRHASSRKRRSQHGDVDMVQERGELLLLPVPCGLPNVSSACDTLSRSCARRVLCWSTFPLVPVLGSTDSAADRSALFVSFAATTTESDFSGPCIGGYDSSSSRRGPAASLRRPNPRPPGSRTKSFHTCQGLRPRRAGRPLALTRPSMSPSVVILTTSADTFKLSRLNGWPMRSPTDASTQPSRIASHGSGTMRFATPSSWRTHMGVFGSSGQVHRHIKKLRLLFRYPRSEPYFMTWWKVLERGRDVVKERFRLGLNRCLVAIEVQAIKVEALLRLKRLLHRLAAIAALLLLCSLRLHWHVRDDQQSHAADQPESSQPGSSSGCDHCAALIIGHRRRS